MIPFSQGFTQTISKGKGTDFSSIRSNLSNFIELTATTEQPKMHRTTKKDILSRLLKLTPLILVVAGCVLTLIGNTASLTSCKIAGPVVITVGGLLLLSITIWSSRKGQETDENTICEEAQRYVNRAVVGEGSNDQLGLIHPTPFDSSGKEMVPPSYEEAVKNNDKESSQSSEVVICDGKELKSDATDAEPPPYEESLHENAK